jgi:hypothetical protein
MRNDFDNPANLIQALDTAIREQRWRVILESFLPMGLSTTRHIQDATGFPRDKATRCIDQLEGFFLEGSPLIVRYEHPLRVPGGSKRPSTIFLFSEASARLLRHLGIEAKACELKDDTAVLHAVCMQSLAQLAGRQPGIQVVTDRNLAYAGSRQLRPDHQIILADGSRFLMEIEQQAAPKLLPRIIESLSHKQAFFTSSESAGFQNTIRMLVNLNPGRDFQKTIKVWKEAIRQVMQTSGEKLNFSLVVLPFTVFLSSPEWEQGLSNRWQKLDPEDHHDNSPAAEQKSRMPSAKRPSRSLEKDIVLLAALAQDFEEKIPEEQRLPDWNLLPLVRTIYEAAHGAKHNTYDEVAAVPVISIYLLREYLNMHPDLLTRLRQAVHFNKTKMVWTQQNILHRMNIVIRTFLSYHGWRPSEVIKIYSTIAGEGRGDYKVSCSWNNTPDEYIQQYRQIERALEWVLSALFEYAEDLGLGKPEFW